MKTKLQSKQEKNTKVGLFYRENDKNELEKSKYNLCP